MTLTKLTQSDINRLARLAQLEISKKEQLQFSKEISAVLNYVNKLQKINTSKEEPTSQTTGLRNICQQDLIDNKYQLNQEQAVDQAKNNHNGLFVTSVLIEK